MGLRYHLRFADLTAGGVGNLAGPNFLSHGAGGVRNSFGHRFAGPRAGRVGDLFRDRVLFVADAGVRNLLNNGFRNLATDSVRLLTVTNFLLHAGAGDGPHFRSRNPAFAADRSAGLFANGAAATRFVNAAATAGVPFPRPGITDTLLNDRARNRFRFRDPFTGADGNFFGFADRLADRVADIAVASLHFRAIRGAADFSIFRFTDGLADRAADVAVARLEARFTDRAADIFVTGLDAGLADRAADIFIAGLETGFLNRAANVFVAGLVAGFADGVAFVAIARFVNRPSAADGNLFRTGIVNCSATIDGALLVNRFANCLVAGSAASFRGLEISTRVARGGRTTLVTGRPAIRGFDFCVGSECQHARDDDPDCVSHLSVP